MIEKLKIRNFQSIEDLTLTLGRVTILKGKTDVGKSAIIRALKAFIFNTFNVEYAHNGKLPCGIAIQKNGIVALGRRTTKGVEYKMGKVLYTKTSKKCPEDILNFLGIHSYQVDQDTSVFFHIQSQHDSPFLLKESSATIAKIIGRVSNLNIVLVAMRDMFSRQLELKQRINFLTGRKKELKTKEVQFSNLKSFETTYNKAESLAERIALIRERVEKITNLINETEAFNTRQKLLKEKKAVFLKAEAALSKMLEKSSLFHDLDATEQSLLKVTKNLEGINSLDIFNRLSSIISIIERLSTVVEVEIASTSFNLKLKQRDSLLKEVSSLRNSFNEDFSLFSSQNVLCPYSMVEMPLICKNNLFKQ